MEIDEEELKPGQLENWNHNQNWKCGCSYNVVSMILTFLDLFWTIQGSECLDTT